MHRSANADRAEIDPKPLSASVKWDRGRNSSPLRRRQRYAVRKQENKMSKDATQKRDTAPDKGLLDRRTLLRAGAAAALAAPIGVFGAQALPLRAVTPNIDFSE